MLVIVSPAKNMKIVNTNAIPLTEPKFISKTEEILKILQTYTPWDLQELMKLNEKLALDSFDRLMSMKLDLAGSAAIETYDGLQYKYMNSKKFPEEIKYYAQDHIRILSGIYGVLKPYDSIYEYRLEMLTKFAIGNNKNLYEFWGNSIYDHLIETSRTIINLASAEYGICVQKYLKPEDTYITCTFKVKNRGVYKVLATAAKMARGRMVRYLMESKIDTLDGIKEFGDDGFAFEPSLSTKYEYVFLQH